MKHILPYKLSHLQRILNKNLNSSFKDPYNLNITFFLKDKERNPHENISLGDKNHNRSFSTFDRGGMNKNSSFTTLKDSKSEMNIPSENKTTQNKKIRLKRRFKSKKRST